MINKLIELLKNHDTVTFKLTGLGEQSFKTVEFKEEIEALEKQIPKEPATRWNGDEILYSSEELICSECKNSICFLEEDIDLVKKYSTYCGVCGQKIDWGVEK